MKTPGQLKTNSREHANAFRVIGLTGGIAAGKSTVARLFEEAGIPVIDADQLSRELSEEGGRAYPTILQRFGTNDRKKLRELVFSDPRAKQDLEAILHPLIHAEFMKRAQELHQPLVIYEAALLVETEYYKTLDGLIVVEAPRELRKQRLIWRNKLSDALAEKILTQQTSDEVRRKVATHIIVNAGNFDDLRNAVQQIVKKVHSIEQ